ncbi:MAG: PDDEXK nuclease domain-containing protein [Sphingobacterium sp.]|uniref:PDDEXK nuclease domain-containing protein n=1 Tax=Sphingobacterium sp. JB170 TaxID=1434842 RepID=UPI000B352AB6
MNQPHVIEENELEQALIVHLQQFIIELGNGFCFEARQKRLLMGDEYYFVDLVFYHRILKCHILVELKRIKSLDENNEKFDRRIICSFGFIYKHKVSFIVQRSRSSNVLR